MDFTRCCRGCMKAMVTDEKNFDQTTVKMFTFCTNIEVSKSKLPRQFCKQCTNAIQSCFTFITTAREVDLNLRYMLLTKKFTVNTDIKLEIPENSQGSDIKPHKHSGDRTFIDINIKPEIPENLQDCEIGPHKCSGDTKRIKIKVEPNVNDSDQKSSKYMDERMTEDIYPTYDSGAIEDTKISSVSQENVVKQNKKRFPGPNAFTSDFQYYRCKLCPEKCHTLKEIQCHKSVAHKSKRQPKTTKEFHCEHCGKRYYHKSRLQHHLRSHDDTLTPIALPPKRVKCDHCKKMFRFKSDLRVHMHVHDTTLRKLLCDVCGTRFSFKHALLEHRRVHTGEKPYTCDLCGYQCSTASNMRRHGRAHRGDRPHQCTHCGKAFVDTNGLRKHIYTHTGERPYKCPHCDKGYRNSSKRKIHIIRAHGIDPKEIPRMAPDGGPSKRKRYNATNNAYSMVDNQQVNNELP